MCTEHGPMLLSVADIANPSQLFSGGRMWLHHPAEDSRKAWPTDSGGDLESKWLPFSIKLHWHCGKVETILVWGSGSPSSNPGS